MDGLLEGEITLIWETMGLTGGKRELQQHSQREHPQQCQQQLSRALWLVPKPSSNCRTSLLSGKDGVSQGFWQSSFFLRLEEDSELRAWSLESHGYL